MNPRTDKSRIGVTQMAANQPPWYVADLPGCDKDKRNPTTPNSDWGYVTKIEQALPLSPYWQRRFQADSRRCGRSVQFYAA